MIRRDVTILRADMTREHMTCRIHEDGEHHGATVVAFEPVDSDAAGFRCVVRGVAL